MRKPANARKAARLSRLAGLALAAGACLLGGCAQTAIPSGSVLSSRASLPPARPLSPQEQKRYADIDRQVLRDQDYRQAQEQAPVATYPYYSYYPAPVSVYGGFYGGRGSRWGTGAYVGPGWWW